MRERWQFNPKTSLLVALLVAAVVDGAIWLTRSGSGSGPVRIVRVPEARPVPTGATGLTSSYGHALLVGAGGDVAYFVMWERDGRSIGGNMTEELITPGQDATFADTFTATVHGSRVTLRLPGQGLDGTRSFSGRLSPHSLVIEAPGQPHGVIRFRVERDLAPYVRIVNRMLARQNANAGGAQQP